MGIERRAHNFCTIWKLEILHQTESQPILFVWMKFDAWNCHVLSVRGLLKSPIDKVYCTIRCTDSSFFVTKHLEIVLENIDNFIGWKSALNSIRNSVNKSFKLLIKICFFGWLFLNLIDKVTRLILATVVDHSVKVCLRAKRFHLIGCLKAYFKYFLLSWRQSSYFVTTSVL